jgi:peptide-methionine (S)-S-oxide reductase
MGSAAVLVGLASRPADAKPRKKPTTTAKAPAGREVATLAAGCFWSMEAIYQQFKGVERVEPGYAGGHVARPSYARVSQGRSGHAEALQITFDPKVVSYADLVNVMLTVRDPTTLNKQGADEGPNYRSVIFFHSPAQQKAARGEIRRVTQARVWKQPIVTRVERFSNFYKAEDYHFNYYNRNIDAPYCKAVIAPKLVELRAKFGPKLKS